jgi:hypothetical protein
MCAHRSHLYIILCALACQPSWAADEPPADAPASVNEAPTNTDAPSNTPTDAADPSSPAPTDTPAIIIPRVTPDTGSMRVNDVLNHLDLFQRSQQVIKFGDDDTTLSGLYLQENTGTPQGGILILHDIEQNALWSQTVGALREYLPDYGWNTLSLFFGNYLQAPLPSFKPEISADDIPPIDIASDATDPITPIDENALSQENNAPDESEADIDQNFTDDPDDSLGQLAEDIGELPTLANEADDKGTGEPLISMEDEFLESMQQRVEDGLRQLNTLGQFNLVIVAYGLSANWAATSLNTRFEGLDDIAGYSLVLINARANQYPAVDLNESLAQLKIPMLDIVTGDSSIALRQATERRNTITRNQNKQYIQIQLPAVKSNLTGKKNLITRRVRGWLKSNAAGEEVNVISR